MDQAAQSGVADGRSVGRQDSEMSMLDRGVSALEGRQRDVARVVLAAALLFGALWWLWYGSHRWFIADDWSYLLYRDVFDQSGWSAMRRALFAPMNGQPAVPSAIQFSLTGALFGWGSYLPFVAVNVALQIVSALLLWRILLRIKVSELTAALVTIVVIFLGPSTEFPALASISNFQYSLVGFLALILLLLNAGDDETTSRGMLIGGAVIGVVVALASGFTLVFALGEFVLGASLRRWRATAAFVVPQLVIYFLWFASYGRGAPRGSAESSLTQVPAWAIQVLLNTFNTIAAPSFGPLLVVLTLALGVATLTARREVRATVYTMAFTMIATTVVIGTQRAANGVDNAATGRYMVVLAFLAAPAIAVAIDRACRSDARYLIVFAVLALTSFVVNTTNWRGSQLFMIDVSTRERAVLSAVEQLDSPDYPRELRPSLCSPDISLGGLPELVERHAIEPIVATPDQQIIAAQMLDPTSITGTDLRACAP